MSDDIDVTEPGSATRAGVNGLGRFIGGAVIIGATGGVAYSFGTGLGQMAVDKLKGMSNGGGKQTTVVKDESEPGGWA